MHVFDAAFAKAREPGLLHKFRQEHAPLGSIESQLIYRGLYDKEYGIFDNVPRKDENGEEHDAIEMPLVAMHWSEDSSQDNPLYESFRAFVRYDIQKYMTFKDLMSLPRNMYEYVIKTCKEKAAEDDKIGASSSAQMKKALEGLKGIVP